MKRWTLQSEECDAWHRVEIHYNATSYVSEKIFPQKYEVSGAMKYLD